MKMESTFKILKIERLNNSFYGNPRYRLTVEDENGEILTGKTETNASLGYAVDYNWKGEKKVIEYHYTKGGNLIFDRLTMSREA